MSGKGRFLTPLTTEFSDKKITCRIENKMGLPRSLHLSCFEREDIGTQTPAVANIEPCRTRVKLNIVGWSPQQFGDGLTI